jgi:chorismate mutase
MMTSPVAHPTADPAEAAVSTSISVAVDLAGAAPPPDTEDVAAQIAWMRERIDEIDSAMVQLWQERAALSRRVGRSRVAAGGTRLVLARERVILNRFRRALGPDGTQVALLLLRAGRGPL